MRVAKMTLEIKMARLQSGFQVCNFLSLRQIKLLVRSVLLVAHRDLTGALILMRWLLNARPMLIQVLFRPAEEFLLLAREVVSWWCLLQLLLKLRLLLGSIHVELFVAAHQIVIFVCEFLLLFFEFVELLNLFDDIRVRIFFKRLVGLISGF